MRPQKLPRNYLIISTILSILLCASSFGQTIYVDVNAKANNDGSSWANAYTSLQDAIATAVKGDEIRVAEGIYKPDKGSHVKKGSRKASFRVKNGLAIYGGFPSGGGKWDDSNCAKYHTILSGDLNSDDTAVTTAREMTNENTRNDNSYNIVTIKKADSTTILDGFIITAGNAGNNHGAAIHNVAASPTISNCVITGNVATCGAGMANCKNSKPTLLNCLFSENASKCCGAAIRNGNSNPVIKDCSFINNWSGCGGAIQNTYSSPTVTNCTFTANSATNGGGAVFNKCCEPAFVNCSFNGNSSPGLGGAVHNCTSDATFTNCIFVANSSQKKGGAIHNCNHGSSPILVNCTLVANYAKYTCGGIHSEHKGSPKLTSCILWANTDRDGSGESAQMFGGRTTANYCCIQGWSGKLTGTGNLDADPLFSNNPDDGGDGFGDNPQTADTDEGSNDSFGSLQLTANSPCINAGDPNPAVGENETDLAGNPRLAGEQIEMGAYELAD